MKHVIGLTGQMGCGKTTAATYIAAKFLPHSEVIPFARPLKEIAKLLGWDGKKDEKGRRLLQLLGTECGRECVHEDVWVHKWEAMIEATEAKVIIADDVRFNNEADAIIRLGGMLIKLNRPTDKKEPLHPSEQGIDPRLITHIYDNNMEIANLCTTMDRLCGGINV